MTMILREYQAEDAALICGWLRSEAELYKWSADRFNKFPLTASDMNESYAPQTAAGMLFPLTAEDDAGQTVGHFIIRYPREDDRSSVRFGFVIVDPACRGKGYGREMLRLGIAYARETRGAKRIDLGVFANNPAAIRCYEALGFREYGRRMVGLPVGTWECIDMELVQESDPSTA